jgi:hypothetical protein
MLDIRELPAVHAEQLKSIRLANIRGLKSLYEFAQVKYPNLK